MDRTSSELVETGNRYISTNYAPKSVVMDHGEGMYLYDKEGKGYLDFVAGIAVNCLGYKHPDLTEALQTQAERLLHVSNMYYTEPQVELLELLAERTFGDRAFLCNSGAEATEAAMKLARRYQQKVAERPEKTKIVSMDKSFHGRTMGAITATGQPKYHDGFRPLVPGYDYTPFNDLSAARQTVDEQTAAVIVEPIQGEGGVRPADPEFLEGLRQRCDEVGALLIFDEVQTGVGRSGQDFAYQTYGVEPDIMALAKGLGGGFPVGATVGTEEAFRGWKKGSHASTWGGNPMACVAAKTVLEVIEREELCQNARRRGAEVREHLEGFAERFDVIDDVRGRGLMNGAECGPEAGDIADLCFEEGLLINTAGGHTLRLVPPLIASSGDVDEAMARLERALERHAAG
jgi:predicted acetylornithine/succinylornithine family transaminase